MIDRAKTAAKMDKLREELKLRNAKFGRLFLSIDGKELLEKLSGEFFEGELVGDTTEQTMFNLGAREVVRYLRHLRDAAAQEK